MNNKFKCDICGESIIGLDEYVKHVKACADKEKAKTNEEYLNKLNSAINKVKQAKAYYDDCLKEFKQKYPKEYDLNFGCNCYSCDDGSSKKVTHATLTKPAGKAENAKKIESSEMSFYDFCKLLGII